MDERAAREELYAAVRALPPGTAASYGEMGARLSAPTTGYVVGRWMNQSPEGVPWWRVVGKDGEIRTGKANPDLAREQRELLEREGVAFVGDAVDMARHGAFRDQDTLL